MQMKPLFYVWILAVFLLALPLGLLGERVGKEKTLRLYLLFTACLILWALFLSYLLLYRYGECDDAAVTRREQCGGAQLCASDAGG